MNDMGLLDHPPRDEFAPLVGITQQEMMRINLEAGANVARLLELWQEGQPMDYLHLLLKAYAYLPMPMRHVKRNNRAAMDVTLAMQYEEIADKSGVDLGLPKLLQQVDPALRAKIKNAPYRALANYYINASYRNGPVEDVHAGNYRRLHLWERCFTNKEIKATLRFTSEQLAGVFTLAPWHLDWREKIEMVLLAGLYTPEGVPAFVSYPQNWSLTLHTSRMEVPLRQPSSPSKQKLVPLGEAFVLLDLPNEDALRAHIEAGRVLAGITPEGVIMVDINSFIPPRAK